MLTLYYRALESTWVIPVFVNILILSVYDATDVFANVIINEDKITTLFESSFWDMTF